MSKDDIDRVLGAWRLENCLINREVIAVVSKRTMQRSAPSGDGHADIG
jgi:hypothetical protein